MNLLLVGENDAARGAIRAFLEELPFNKFVKIVDLTIDEFDSISAVHELDASRLMSIDLIIAEQNKSNISGKEFIQNLFSERLNVPAIIYGDGIADNTSSTNKIFPLPLPTTCEKLKGVMEKIATSLINVKSKKVEAQISELEATKRGDDYMSLLENILMRNIRTLLAYQAYAPWISLPSLRLGQAYLKSGEFEEAIPYLKRAIAIDFHLTEAHDDLALCYRKTGASFQEREELEVELKAHPNSPALLLKIGEATLRDGDYEDAVAYFKQAIKNHKAHYGNRLKAKIHVGLGKAYFDDGTTNDNEGKINQAKDEFKQAIEFDPLLIAAYNNLIIVYKKLGMNNEAKATVATVEKITPNSADGWLELFQVYLYDGEANKAKYSLQKAIKYRPDSISTLITAGNTYLRQFMFNDAVELFEKALELNPSDPHVYNCLGICFKRLRNINKSIEYYHKALKFTPSDPYLHYNLGKAYYHGENISLARKEYEIAMKLGLEVGDNPITSSDSVKFPDFFNRREEQRRRDGVPSKYISEQEKRIADRRVGDRRKGSR